MVHGLETLAAALAKDADAVDDRVVAGQEWPQQALAVDRQVDEPDLADIALQLQELGLGGIASTDGQHVAALGQPLDHIAADEPGPAEDRNPMLLHLPPLKVP